MPDKISAEQRSRIMSRVRTRGTAAELAVRKALFAARFRYRLHPKNLPGRPDIVLPRYRVAVARTLAPALENRRVDHDQAAFDFHDAPRLA
jgi:DNA mismatch endonuclease Vsr